MKLNRYVFLTLIGSISIVFAGLRIHGIKSEIFQALAHLWVGGLIGNFLTLCYVNVFVKDISDTEELCQLTGFSALILSIVELACFLFLK